MITHPVLTDLAARGIKLGLGDLERFLEAVGSPHRGWPAIHVAGTNGKGSVCTMATAALVAAGYRVGTTLSPHLEHVNERIRIDGVPVDDAWLTRGIADLDAARRRYAATAGLDEPPLTYFEFLIALAFRAFASHEVEVGVVEVGLGGRLDATNLVEPVVCAITSIGLDHTEMLGETLAAIAAEKAGIIKPGVPVVVGPVAPEAEAVIARIATDRAAPVWWVGREIVATAGRWETPYGVVEGHVGMAGPHQVSNAGVVVGVVHRLRQAGWAIPDLALAHGIAHGRLAGRAERLAPGLLVDGAHNVAGTTALAALLGPPPPQGRTLLWGMGEDRDPATVVAPLLPCITRIVTTRCAHPKARAPRELALALQGLDVPVQVGGDVESALPLVRDGADVVVAGSLFLVGAVRSLVL